MASSPWSPIDDNTNNASSNGTAPSHIADNELGPLPAPYLASRTDSGYDSCVPIQMPIQMPIPRTDFNTAHFCESPSHWGVDLTPDNRVMTQGNIGCSAFNNYSSVHTFELPDAAVGYKTSRPVKFENRGLCDRFSPDRDDTTRHQKSTHEKQVPHKAELMQSSIQSLRDQLSVRKTKKQNPIQYHVGQSGLSHDIDWLERRSSIDGSGKHRTSALVVQDLAEHDSVHVFRDTQLLPQSAEAARTQHPALSCTESTAAPIPPRRTSRKRDGDVIARPLFKNRALNMEPLEDALGVQCVKDVSRGSLRHNALSSRHPPALVTNRTSSGPEVNVCNSNTQSVHTSNSPVQRQHSTHEQPMFECGPLEVPAGKHASVVLEDQQSQAVVADRADIIGADWHSVTAAALRRALEMTHTHTIPTKVSLHASLEAAKLSPSGSHPMQTFGDDDDDDDDDRRNSDQQIKIPVVLDPGIYGLEKLDTVSLQAPSQALESCESSSAATDFDDDDASSLAGLSAYSDELNAADEDKWLSMSKVAFIDNFVDDVIDCVEHVVGDVLVDYTLSDTEGAGRSGTSYDGSSISGCANSPVQTQESQSNTSSTSGQGKHKRTDDHDDGDSDGDQRRSKGRKTTRGDRVTSPKRPVACPYLKRSPLDTTGNSCRAAYKDMSRLKEHLERRHRKPIYCHRCKEVYKSDSELEEHQTRNDSCDRREEAMVPDGLTIDQEKKIRAVGRKPREPDVEKKWGMIYLIIFPKEVSIPSPWHELTLEQDAALQEVMNQLLQTVPSEVEKGFRSHQEPNQREPNADLLKTLRLRIQKAIRHVFESYRSKMSSQQQFNPRDTPGVSTSTPKADSARPQSSQSLQVPSTPTSNRVQNVASFPPNPSGLVPTAQGQRLPNIWRTNIRDKFSSRPTQSNASRSDMSAGESLQKPLKPIAQESLGGSTSVGDLTMGMQPVGVGSDLLNGSSADKQAANGFTSPMDDPTKPNGHSSKFQMNNSFAPDIPANMQDTDNNIPDFDLDLMEGFHFDSSFLDFGVSGQGAQATPVHGPMLHTQPPFPPNMINEYQDSWSEFNPRGQWQANNYENNL